MQGNTSIEGKEFTILHFNDVYEIRESAKNHVCGGVARFDTLLKSYADENPIILFSGDLWNPSKLSSEFKGTQNYKSINMFGIKCSVLGNHDLDFGEEQCEILSSNTNFPWILSNVKKRATNETIAKTMLYYIFDHNGVKFGVIGLAEEEWLAT